MKEKGHPMNHETMSIGKNILTAVISSVVTGAIVFGYSSLQFRDEVHGNTKDLNYVRKDISDIKAQAVSDKIEFSARQNSIAALVQENLKQSTELIQLLRLQQQVVK
jgi:tetrahydrodipicolinate N-succinyltransferase